MEGSKCVATNIVSRRPMAPPREWQVTMTSVVLKSAMPACTASRTSREVRLKLPEGLVIVVQSHELRRSNIRVLENLRALGHQHPSLQGKEIPQCTTLLGYLSRRLTLQVLLGLPSLCKMCVCGRQRRTIKTTECLHSRLAFSPLKVPCSGSVCCYFSDILFVRTHLLHPPTLFFDHIIGHPSNKLTQILSIF
jgi:hypothetical protein